MIPLHFWKFVFFVDVSVVIAVACQAKISFSSPWLEQLQQLIKILFLVFL